MERDLILTCDAGTTGCKCTVFDPSGEALATTREDYPTAYPHPNWAEQDADAVADAAMRGIRALLGRVEAGRVACVGLSGTMNGCIPVDETGAALHPNIIHSDSRTQAQVDEILRVIPADEFYGRTGNRADTHYALPKILWLRDHAPDVHRRARWYLNIKDYIYGRLTGRFGFTDWSDASLTIALDIRERRWMAELLADLGVDAARMPALLNGQDLEGRVTAEAARLTGLVEGTPVAIGGGDAACTARGAGVSAAGNAYTCIGSSAWVSQLLDRPLLDPQARIFSYLDMDGEHYHNCGAVQCGAAAYDWALENLLGGGEAEEDIAGAEALARQVGPGAEGVLFLPTLMGSRTPYWDPNTRGCLLGFSLYHDRRHIARAVYEGLAFALKDCAAIMAECGSPVRSMMLTGGGARSGLWPDMLAAAFGVPTRVHRTPGETTTLGAAIAAGVGAGIFPDYAAAARIVSARSEHPVNPEWRAAYDRVYPIFADIYARVRPLNDRIAALDFGE